MRWWQAAVLLALAFVAANWQLITGQAFEKWDAFELSAPYYSLLADFIRAGKLIYWNPWLACGSPDFAVAGSGNFSPDLLLAAAITGPGGRAFVSYWLSIWLAGGMGMLILARHLRAPAWGGLVVALGFVFSGFYTGHAEHNSVVYSYSLLPFIIWRLDVAITQRRILPASQAGAFWGLSGLAGYPALTIFTVALIVAWAVGRWVASEKMERARSCKYAVLAVIVVGLIGVAVLSPSYLSAAYEGKGYSDRSEPLSRAYALESNSLQPGTLISMSSPALVTIAIEEFEHDQRELWAKTDLSSVNLYTGGLILVLALLALTGKGERRWRWYLFAIACLALACAMSDVFPFRGWLYDLVPPTRYFRHASMLRGYFLFLLSLLALLGARDLANESGAPRRLLFLIPILAISALIGFAVVLSKAAIEHPERTLAYGHAIVFWGGLLCLAFILLRLTSAEKFLPLALVVFALFDGLAAIHFTRGTLFNLGPRAKFPFPLDSSVALGPARFGRAIGSGRVNANFYFKIPTLKNYAPFRNRFHEWIVADPSLQVLALGKRRVWFAADAPEVSPTKEVFAHFVRRWAELEAPLLLRHPRAEMLDPTPPTPEEFAAIEQTAAATLADCTVTDYQPNRLVLETNAPSDGWLMVSDRWSRSWHALVNGIEQPVSGANFIFRAVPVTRGNNRVEFSFQPVGMPGLVIFSWSILGVIAALTLVRRVSASREMN